MLNEGEGVGVKNVQREVPQWNRPSLCRVANTLRHPWGGGSPEMSVYRREGWIRADLRRLTCSDSIKLNVVPVGLGLVQVEPDVLCELLRAVADVAPAHMGLLSKRSEGGR